MMMMMIVVFRIAKNVIIHLAINVIQDFKYQMVLASLVHKTQKYVIPVNLVNIKNINRINANKKVKKIFALNCS
jgi:hypothetical protein